MVEMRVRGLKDLELAAKQNTRAMLELTTAVETLTEHLIDLIEGGK